MSIVDNIASYSTNMSMSNIKQDVSLKVLKNMMEQSEESMMDMLKILEVPFVSNGSSVDYSV